MSDTGSDLTPRGMFSQRGLTWVSFVNRQGGIMHHDRARVCRDGM